MSLCLSLSLTQNKLTCHYVFYYPVHQHDTCGALTQDVRGINTKETRQHKQSTNPTPLPQEELPHSSKHANVLTPLTPFLSFHSLSLLDSLVPNTPSTSGSYHKHVGQHSHNVGKGH